MPELPFPDHVRDLLAKPNPAVVSTLRKDGQPVSVATWYLLEDDDRVLLNMDAHPGPPAAPAPRPAAHADRARRGQLVHPRLADRPGRGDGRRRGARRHRPAEHPLQRPALPQPREPARERVDGDRPVARLGRGHATERATGSDRLRAPRPSRRTP